MKFYIQISPTSSKENSYKMFKRQEFNFNFMPLLKIKEKENFCSQNIEDFGKSLKN